MWKSCLWALGCDCTVLKIHQTVFPKWKMHWKLRLVSLVMALLVSVTAEEVVVSYCMLPSQYEPSSTCTYRFSDQQENNSWDKSWGKYMLILNIQISNKIILEADSSKANKNVPDVFLYCLSQKITQVLSGNWLDWYCAKLKLFQWSGRIQLLEPQKFHDCGCMHVYTRHAFVHVIILKIWFMQPSMEHPSNTLWWSPKIFDASLQ